MFDFDGAIIDSNRMKYGAFFQIFSSDRRFEKIVKQTLADYREQSRFHIIKQVLLKFQKERGIEFTDLDEKIVHYAEKYNTIVEKGAIECDEIKGAGESLKALSTRFSLYIDSSTPLDSLKRIILKRSLMGFFKDIYGAPKSKIENLSEILEKEKISGSEALVVGDGQSDLEAAQRFGCKFIRIRNSFNNFTGRDFNVLDDLRDLPNLVHAFKNEDIYVKFPHFTQEEDL